MKHKIILILAGAAAGYLLADTLSGLNGGNNPFNTLYAKGHTTGAA